MSEIKFKDGTLAKDGDVIRWCCEDSDDCTTWTFTGMYRFGKVVYLGGGIDFGLGIGKEMSIDEVIDESENNDSCCAGIEKVGTAINLVRKIKEIYND